MIFLHSIFHGATGVIRESGAIEKHKNIVRCTLLPAYTNVLLKVNSLGESVNYGWNGHKI